MIEANEYLHKADKHLEAQVKYQSSSLKKKCIIIVVAIVVIAAIIFVLYKVQVF
jgi:t-SNARE complex subunit (syntaxin)